MSVSAESRVGSELLGYCIAALVGRGGMGVVYRAHDPRLKRDVALKLLAPELANDRAFRERFLRESELAAGLEHPNVVPIHDAGEVNGQLYIAMRLVEGTDLKALLEPEGSLESRGGRRTRGGPGSPRPEPWRRRRRTLPGRRRRSGPGGGSSPAPATRGTLPRRRCG